MQGADEAVFALASVLLLLSQDPLILPTFSASRRCGPRSRLRGLGMIRTGCTPAIQALAC